MNKKVFQTFFVLFIGLIFAVGPIAQRTVLASQTRGIVRVNGGNGENPKEPEKETGTEKEPEKEVEKESEKETEQSEEKEEKEEKEEQGQTTSKADPPVKPQSPGGLLPDTGGMASRLLTFIGGAVLLLFLILLWKRRKKESLETQEIAFQQAELEKLLEN